MAENGLELLGKAALIFTIIFIVIKIAQIIFILSIILLFVGIIFLLVTQNSEWLSEIPPQIFIYAIIIFFLSFLIGIAFPASNLGSIVIDTGNQVIYLDNEVNGVISEARTTLYVSLLETFGDLLLGEDVVIHYIENETLPFEEEYQIKDNITYFYIQSLTGINITKDIYSDAVRLSTVFNTVDGDEFCNSRCFFESTARNYDFNFSVNANISYQVSAIDSFGDWIKNYTVSSSFVNLPYSENVVIKTKQLGSEIKKPFRLELNSNSTKIVYNLNNNTKLMNFTKTELVNKTRTVYKVIPTEKSKTVRVIDNKLYYLLVRFA